jgi:hypothetical protein
MTERSSDAPSVVKGDVIDFKPDSPLLLAILGAIALALGGACWAIHFALEEWLARTLGRYETLFPLLGCALGGAGLLLFFLAYRGVLRPVKRMLVIGEDRLQFVENEEKVVEQYHYRDLLAYRVTGKAIGIELAASLSEETIPAPEDVRGFRKETFGYEAVVEPNIVCSQQELLEKLQTRLNGYAKQRL